MKREIPEKYLIDEKQIMQTESLPSAPYQYFPNTHFQDTFLKQ